MRKLITTALASLALASLFLSHPALAASCADQAVDKNGKPLKGAAKTSFIKKCESQSASSSCEAKAVGKDGKPLKGAAKTSFMKKCSADAGK